MMTKNDFTEKIEEQLAKWQSTIDGLKEKLAHAEVDAKAKLHDQMESLNAKRVRAEQILADISVTSQDVWEQIKSGAEQGWSDLTRTAKSTMDKVREAMASPKREEEIRLIAYEIWLNEGCPHGRHEEHWFKAESIWQARQDQNTPPVEQAPAKTKRSRRKSATQAASKSRSTKPKAGASKKRPDLGEKAP
ncbi:MAG TPA: DUF2934 domain-containing protein [Candidatus Binatia bacterium]